MNRFKKKVENLLTDIQLLYFAMTNVHRYICCYCYPFVSGGSTYNRNLSFHLNLYYNVTQRLCKPTISSGWFDKIKIWIPSNAIKRKVQQIKFSHAKRPPYKERHYAGAQIEAIHKTERALWYENTANPGHALGAPGGDLCLFVCSTISCCYLFIITPDFSILSSKFINAPLVGHYKL